MLVLQLLQAAALRATDGGVVELLEVRLVAEQTLAEETVAGAAHRAEALGRQVQTVRLF